MLAPWKESYDKPRQAIKKQRHHFADKGPCSQIYGFSSSHVWLWELDHKEGWAPNFWCLWTVVLEKTLESPLDSKKIKPVNLKGNQPWIFIGRTDAEAEAPILWPPNVKDWLIGKDPDAGKDWTQEEKEVPEDEMAGWHHHSMDMNLSKLWEMKDWEVWRAAVHRSQRVGHNWVNEQQRNLKKQWLVYISTFLHYHFIHIKDLWSFSFFFFFYHILQLVGFSLTRDWSNPSPLQWKHEILTTVPPEKFHSFLI